jgi:hypothetical protein
VLNVDQKYCLILYFVFRRLFLLGRRERNNSNKRSIWNKQMPAVHMTYNKIVIIPKILSSQKLVHSVQHPCLVVLLHLIYYIPGLLLIHY